MDTTARKATRPTARTPTERINFLDHIRKNKSLLLIIALLVLGLLLILLPSTDASENASQGSEERLERYGRELEERIAALCSRVRGVGSVSVNVYFDSGFETVYAYNEESKDTSSGRNEEKKYVTVGSGNNERLVCIVERMPSICGVAVVCSGGGDPAVQSAIINLISSAYGVPKNKIFVAEGKK